MHIGFFQPGAQNHATSRALVLEAGETQHVTDCFCIQAAQGGLLKESQQRFLMLPLDLRCQALAKRHIQGYSRLWGDIDRYTRHYGLATGGHLERFLRPNFDRLLPLRHALETSPGQVGAAYFVAGRLAGIEVTPSQAYWQQLAPILAMYCYGPAALLAERRGHQRVAEPLDLEPIPKPPGTGSFCGVFGAKCACPLLLARFWDRLLEGLTGLDDLTARLADVRHRESCGRADIVQELATQSFHQDVDEDRHGLRVLTLSSGTWTGQVVRDAQQTVYASVFRDVLAQLGGDGSEGAARS